ncbi:hypothetical protein [Actinocrinis sp.]|uniref:hypothetical protein n=1 Tax=Actinocrinis sp. TaxID=1920516 RepID=UPI002B52813A|nr:hypothetical protein [Actinocrinis sp.]HXR74230.1 hypothetical protein [Actinocrinis sp.]
MEFFCYHRDRAGSAALRVELVEKHWSYMDQYAKEIIGVNEHKVATGVSKRDGWRVFHPARLSWHAVAGIILLGGGASLATGYGIDLLAEKGDIGSFLYLLGFALAALGFLYFNTFAYYVAIDDRYVAQGRRRRAPADVIERSAVSYTTWGFIHGAVHGQLHDEGGNVLMLIEPSVERKQLVAIAQELGVPFRSSS